MSLRALLHIRGVTDLWSSTQGGLLSLPLCIDASSSGPLPIPGQGIVTCDAFTLSPDVAVFNNATALWCVHSCAASCSALHNLRGHIQGSVLKSSICSGCGESCQSSGRRVSRAGLGDLPSATYAQALQLLWCSHSLQVQPDTATPGGSPRTQCDIHYILHATTRII